ncbi:hypothetical protein HOY82DRAFT_554200 [Tuber indicum]|nr:hypothetical protein HOY82DRAFT_554200 [Tuber indicum]
MEVEGGRRLVCLCFAPALLRAFSRCVGCASFFLLNLLPRWQRSTTKTGKARHTQEITEPRGGGINKNRISSS